MWNTFDVNVLVNGNRCKQYNHDNRVYIEAKDGSEYSISIQNNTANRVLAVCSVDGLNVLTGEKASTEDSGYIIDAYNTQKSKDFDFLIQNGQCSSLVINSTGRPMPSRKTTALRRIVE
jgi:hypothetical protein